MASSQLSRRPVRRAVRVWGSARVAEAGITADEERRLRTRGLPEVSGIASLTGSRSSQSSGMLMPRVAAASERKAMERCSSSNSRPYALR